MTTYLVTCANGGLPVAIKAPDKDVAIYRAKLKGLKPISARPKHA